MGMFTNWYNPSKWRANDSITGAGAARKQEKGAEKATDRALGYYNNAWKYGKDQFGQARSDIISGNTQAQGTLGQHYDAARSDVLTNNAQAANAISSAPNRLADLYNGGLRSGFETDPGYEFRLKQGEDAIMRNFAARGGRGGGDAMKAILEHGQNFASNEYDQYANRQMGLAGAADQRDVGQAQSLGDIYVNQGARLSDMGVGQGRDVAGILSGQGTDLASLGTNAANFRLGIAGGKAGAATGVVPYIGGADQATANFAGGLFNLGGAAAGKALGSAVGGG